MSIGALAAPSMLSSPPEGLIVARMRSLPAIAACLGASLLLMGGCGRHHSDANTQQPLSQDIKAIFDKQVYRAATWGLRVVDLDSGAVIHDVEPERQFLIASVRKLFSVGALLDQVGPAHTFTTPVHAQGIVNGGVLNGDLILVASGDLTMGGRRNANGSFAIKPFDHNEANSLGNAELTDPDPLAGYAALARQVAASGITRVSGEVVIDDRLFVPFRFRNEFNVSAIFVNDDAVDVIIERTSPGAPAAVNWRPKSAAFAVVSTLQTTGAGSSSAIALAPEVSACIGSPGCTGTVSGQLPIDFVPAVTGAFPLIRTFRIVEPANYVRSVFIEALRNAGVQVDASTVAANPVARLPAKNSYSAATRVAQLVSFPYSDDAKLIFKVSYNIGADTSLVLFGLARGVDNMADSLAVERQALAAEHGIGPGEFSFADGSGGGSTRATNRAVTTFLESMSRRSSFAAFRDALPILGVDGSLATTNAFERDPSLAGAKGQVFAKTGTFIEGTAGPPLFRAKALAGYVNTRSGRRLAFTMAVNEVGPIDDFGPIFETVQDMGTISAILWRDN